MVSEQEDYSPYAENYEPGENVIDLRDVAERLIELCGRTERVSLGEDDEPLDEDEQDEVAAIIDLARQFGIIDDNDGYTDVAAALEHYGDPALIADSYFEDYAERTAYDIGMVDEDSALASYVDWERWANDLKMDYRSVKFGNAEYWARG